MRIHFWSVLALAACGSGSSNSIVPGSDGGTAGDLANLASGADLATTRTDMAAPPKTTLPTAFGSYIELGDSISDGGGEPPFFYNLLFSNDDTNYPTWSGLDLKTRFNVQQHVHGAVAGAQTKDVPGQVTKLPASLPGPVLITITIGGNDITNNAVAVLQNNDMTEREAMRTNLDTFLSALTAPDRFGAGVAVYILETDIYDPSDGTGDLSSCPAPLSYFPKQPSDPVFARWNQVVTDELGKYANGFVEPLHDTFYGHGVVSSDNWFYTDCIHPKKIGHHELRRMMWKALTGQDGPA